MQKKKIEVPKTMNTQGINKKRVVAFMLSMLLIMQQSLTYQVLAASTITNADGSTINPSDGNTWNIGPDAVNGNTGFKQFDKINLEKGDVLNFIYSYIKQKGYSVDWNADNGTHSVTQIANTRGNIDTFVNLVNNGVNINGIVNALQSANGALKTDGNLVFISPNGMVVGSSGVINVGNLSVISPTQTSYDKLSDYLALPKHQVGNINRIDITENNPVTQGKYTLDIGYDNNVLVAEGTNKTLNLSTLTDGAGNTLSLGGKAIQIDAGGRVAARGNVDLQGGTIANNGLLLAGLGNNETAALTGHDAADTLFTKLVNIDNMGTANTFVNNNGNISIKSVTGTSVGNGAKVRNYGTGNITIENSGANGISIAGWRFRINSK